jgi:uncharacterized Fe-S cluster protein YjdI
MNEIIKKYSNGEITIVWKPNLCIHSTKCWKGETALPEVFNPAKKPWIVAEASSSKRIMEQIDKCPSGALSYYLNDKDTSSNNNTEIIESIIEVSKNGPLLVYGNITIKDYKGAETKKNKVTAFCRCGFSNNKPYCDGSHVTEGFEG